MFLDKALASVKERPAAYVLCSNSGDYFYKGSCRNLVKRMKDHLAGRVRHTKNKRPLRLVYFEYCESYTVARQRETDFNGQKTS